MRTATSVSISTEQQGKGAMQAEQVLPGNGTAIVRRAGSLSSTSMPGNGTAIAVQAAHFDNHTHS